MSVPHTPPPLREVKQTGRKWNQNKVTETKRRTWIKGTLSVSSSSSSSILTYVMTVKCSREVRGGGGRLSYLVSSVWSHSVTTADRSTDSLIWVYWAADGVPHWSSVWSLTETHAHLPTSFHQPRQSVRLSSFCCLEQQPLQGEEGDRGVRRGRQQLNTCVCACVCVWEHSCNLNTGSLQVCIRTKPADTSNNSLINSHLCFFFDKRLCVHVVSLWVKSAASVCRSTLQTGSVSYNNTHWIFVSYGWCNHSTSSSDVMIRNKTQTNNKPQRTRVHHTDAVSPPQWHCGPLHLWRWRACMIPALKLSVNVAPVTWRSWPQSALFCLKHTTFCGHRDP